MTLDVSNEDGEVAIFQDDILLTRYRAVTSGSKPHFDTVALPASAGECAGTNLVLSAPHDHVWHFGLFFVPKLVDGINCWESELNEDLGRPYGYATNDKYSVHQGDEQVAITQDATWSSSEGEDLLEDTREIEVRAPEEGSYLIVWNQQLEALEQTRHLSSETLHGHYSGLSVRFARSLTDGWVTFPSSQDPGDVPREERDLRGAWCDYTGNLDGRYATRDSWEAGLTLMDHPENDEFPLNWFTVTEPYGFIGGNPTWKTVRTIEQGEPLSWQWGAWVHAGERDREQITDAHEGFCQIASK